MDKIIYRLGIAPGERCERNYDCPDLLRLENGDIAAIGRRADPGIFAQLPGFGASVGSDEGIVIVPGWVFGESVVDYVRRLAVN